MARCFQWTFLFPVDSLGSQKAREKFQKYGIIYPATPLCFSSFRFSHLVVSNSLRHHELQHATPPCPSPTPRVHSNSLSIESVMSSSHLIPSPPLREASKWNLNVSKWGEKKNLEDNVKNNTLHKERFWKYCFSSSKPCHLVLHYCFHS